MSGNVRDIPPERLEEALARLEARTLKEGGGPPDNGDMEPRVRALEDFAQQTRDRLTRIETKLDAFPAVFATKEDLHKAINDQTWKIIGAMITLGTLLSAIVFFIARNVK